MALDAMTLQRCERMFHHGHAFQSRPQTPELQDGDFARRRLKKRYVASCVLLKHSTVAGHSPRIHPPKTNERVQRKGGHDGARTALGNNGRACRTSEAAHGRRAARTRPRGNVHVRRRREHAIDKHTYDKVASYPQFGTCGQA